MPLWTGATTILIKLNKAALVVAVTIGKNFGASLILLNKSTLYGEFYTRLFQSKPTFWPKEFTVTPYALSAIMKGKL
jgi:hypothetical protein